MPYFILFDDVYVVFMTILILVITTVALSACHEMIVIHGSQKFVEIS